MQRLVGYSLFPVRKLIHGAQIRPFYLCKELGIPLYFQPYPHTPPSAIFKAISLRATILVFLGYTTDQADQLLLYLAKLLGCRIIIDVADIPYMQYRFFHGKPSPKSERDFFRLVKLADVLLFATTALERWTSRLTDLGDKECHVVQNATDPDHFKFTPLPRENIVSYVGGYIPARGVGELLEAFRILRRRRIDCTLDLVSQGFPESVSEPGLRVRKSVYYDKIPMIFESSLVFAIPHRTNPYMNAATPLKLFDAMAAGRPIVATDCEETATLIYREKCGIVVGESPESIADGIQQLFENRLEAARMGKRGRFAVERRHSWKVRGEQIRSFLDQ